jgi:hypothetical protein
MASPGLIVLPCTTTLKTPCFTDEITVNVAVEHRTEQTFLKPICPQGFRNPVRTTGASSPTRSAR